MPLFSTRKEDKKVKVVFANGLLFVEKDGGKPQAFPLDWFPQLKNATEEELADWTQTLPASTGTNLMWTLTFSCTDDRTGIPV